MSEAFHGNLRHVLFALLVAARVGDLVTTYLMTPTLVLEANPLVRRFGWRYALLTSCICVVPYFSLRIGLAFVVASLMVCAGNASRIWVARTMGERAQRDFMVTLAQRSKRWSAISGVLASAFFIILAGLVVLLFYSTFRDWGFWIGLGIVSYGGVIAVHGTLFVVRLFREAASRGPMPSERPPNNQMQLTSARASHGGARS